jgi:hypothetical protein
VIHSISSQLQEILAHQRLPSGEKDHGRAEIRQVVQEAESLLFGEFLLVPAIRGMGIAVNTLQIACPGDIPYDYRFFIDGELEQMGREITGSSSVAKRIRGFYCSTI